MIIAVLAFAGFLGTTDDLLPAAIDALLEPIDQLPFFGEVYTAQGTTVFRETAVGTPRASTSLGDITGDGADDVVTGLYRDAPGDTLVARDGQTGTVLWSAHPNGGYFRSHQALAVDAGRLAVGLTSPQARVELRHCDGGVILWTRDFTSGSPRAEYGVYSIAFAQALSGNSDVIVGTGSGIDSVTRLRSLDGSTAWTLDTPGPVYSVAQTGDLTGDGIAEIVATGGDQTPFAIAIDGLTGLAIWQIALPGPGSTIFLGADINQDGFRDLLVGLFLAGGPGLLCLNGQNGSTLWEATSLTHPVTSIAPLGNAFGDGAIDVAVGSLDNALSGISGAHGYRVWRKEFTVNNGGSVLFAASAGDTDGNGVSDIYCTSVDHFLYAINGDHGTYLWSHRLRGKGAAVTALSVQGKNNKGACAAGSLDTLTVFDGASGLASGPIIGLSEGPYTQEMHILIFSTPGTAMYLLGSLDTGSLSLPGFDQPFGLDPSQTALLVSYTGPAAGGQAFVIGPFVRELIGVTVYFQAASLYPSGGPSLFSDVVSFTIAR